jgi:hypothetical protein
MHPQVSRTHARIVVRDGELLIEDMASTTGTFVNGQRVEQQSLREGDTIRIGPVRMVLKDGRLQVVDEEGNLRLDAFTCRRSSRRASVSFKTYRFPSIRRSLSPSSGQAVQDVHLLNALCGFRPAPPARSFSTGRPVRPLRRLPRELGYVPQDDIIHRELTVFKALDYAAQLRMPSDTTTAERRERIREVLGSST